MKTLPYLILFLILGCNLNAQEEINEEGSRKKLLISHQFGLNSTSFLNKVVRIGIDSSNVNPYLLTYRLGLGKMGVRAGIGGTSKYEKQTEEGYADSKSVNRQSLDLRLGVDRQWQFGQRWQVNAGLDLASKRSIFKEITDSGFDVIEKTNQIVAYGGGPFLGINFWLNDHIGLYTEATFYFLYASTDNARIFKNFPELNDELFHVTTAEVNTVLPASIFLVFRF